MRGVAGVIAPRSGSAASQDESRCSAYPSNPPPAASQDESRCSAYPSNPPPAASQDESRCSAIHGWLAAGFGDGK